MSSREHKPPRGRGSMKTKSAVYVCMAFVERLGSMICRSLGPAFMIFGMTLIAVVCFIALYWDPLVPKTEVLWKRLLINCVGIFFASNVYFNWIMCARTHPGRPPRDIPPPTKHDRLEAGLHQPGDPEEVLINTSEDSHITQRRVLPGADGAYSITPDGKPHRSGWGHCRKCVNPKPPRTHHCSICDSCILAMDHHCPWVASCVGFFNYRYFYLFLFHLVCACTYVICVGTYYYAIFDVFMPFFGFALKPKPLEAQRLTPRIGSGTSFVILMCAAVGPAVAILLVFHTYLVVTAQTTIEFYARHGGQIRDQYSGKLNFNEYDLGMTKNWELVFGKSNYPFAWARPSFRKPPGNGMSRPKAKSLLLNYYNEQIV